MKRLCALLFIIFLSANAADLSFSEDVFDGAAILHTQAVRIAPGYYIFTLSLKAKEGQELGCLQFKFFDVQRKPKTSQIDFIIIAEEVRGKGNGDWLLKKTLGVMKELQCLEVKAGVHSGNQASMRLFEKNGFTIDGEPASHALGGEQIPLRKQL